MPNLIESLHVKGFRSLADVKIDNMPRAAVLIGTNGSGKSNLLRFIEMMSSMINDHRLNMFVQLRGGANDQLFGGSDVSEAMEAELAIRTDNGRNEYRFVLKYASEDRFVFVEEAFRSCRKGLGKEAGWTQIGGGHFEAKIVEHAQSANARDPTTARVLRDLLRRCAVYQFNDTSFHSRLKKKWDATDCTSLRSDGGNLAAVLLRLEQEDPRRFTAICRHIQRVLPVFDRFYIEDLYGYVMLRWKARGMDKTIGAHLTSDGSLRLFALMTLLNLPPEMLPDVLLLDEPELGLHPTAITLVGSMIKVQATKRQVIVATQSPLLVDVFDLDAILVLEMYDGRTKVLRYDENKYRHWLDEYATGELWQMNLLGGRP